MGNSFDDLIANFDCDDVAAKDGSKSGAMVGHWLPDDYKRRYDELQSRSGKKFGKLIKKLIMHAIDVKTAS